MSEPQRPTPEAIIDTLIAEWPSGLARPLGEVRREVLRLRAELAAARAALRLTHEAVEELGRGEERRPAAIVLSFGRPDFDVFASEEDAVSFAAAEGDDRFLWRASRGSRITWHPARPGGGAEEQEEARRE